MGIPGYARTCAGWTAGLLMLLSASPAPPVGAQPTAASETYDFTLSKGLLEFSRGRYQEAAKLFRDATAAKPRDVEAQDYLGQALLRLDDYAGAEQVYANLLTEFPTSARGFVGLGLSQIKLGKYQNALANLAAAETLSPDDPLIYYYQGLAYQGLKAYELSPPLFARAIKLSPDLEPSARYYTGVAYYEMGRVEEAEREFKAALAYGDPESQLSRSAREFLTERGAPRQPDEPRRWDLSLSVSEQYDTNVVLLPLGTQPSPDTGISDKDDYVTTLYARGEYRMIQTGPWTMGTSYGFFQSFHRELSGFDVQSHAPSAYLQRTLGPVFARVQYAFDYVEVGRAPYLIAQAVQPTFTIVEGRSFFTQLRFHYQYKNFRDAKFAGNSNRDGRNWLASVSQYMFFAEGEGNFRVGYTYDRDDTGGGSPVVATPGVQTNADWDYTGHRLSAGLDLPAIFTIKPSAAFEYYKQDYANPSSFSPTGTTRRKDEILFVTGSLSREIAGMFTVSAAYSYTRDQSNLTAFDYARSLYSISLSAKF